MPVQVNTDAIRNAADGIAAVAMAIDGVDDKLPIVHIATVMPGSQSAASAASAQSFIKEKMGNVQESSGRLERALAGAGSHYESNEDYMRNRFEQGRFPERFGDEG